MCAWGLCVWGDSMLISSRSSFWASPRDALGLLSLSCLCHAPPQSSCCSCPPQVGGGSSRYPPPFPVSGSSPFPAPPSNPLPTPNLPVPSAPFSLLSMSPTSPPFSEGSNYRAEGGINQEEGLGGEGVSRREQSKGRETRGRGRGKQSRDQGGGQEGLSHPGLWSPVDTCPSSCR